MRVRLAHPSIGVDREGPGQYHGFKKYIRVAVLSRRLSLL